MITPIPVLSKHKKEPIHLFISALYFMWVYNNYIGSYQTPVDSCVPQRGLMSGMANGPVYVYVRLQSICPHAQSSAAADQSNRDDFPELLAPWAEECWNLGGQYDWLLGRWNGVISI